jgi:hypothetical protein
MTTDQLWKLLEATQAQIRAFDTKAQIVLGIDSVLAGFLGSQLLKAAEFSVKVEGKSITLLWILSISALATTLISLAFAAFTIHPMLKLDQPQSHLFFSHLVELYGRNFNKASEELQDHGEEALRKDLGTQIQTTAVICDIKAARFRKSITLMACSLALYSITLVPFINAARNANRMPSSTVVK